MPKQSSKTAPGSAGRASVDSDGSVTAEVADLERLGVDDLRALWKRRFRQAIPRIQSPDILRRLIAWKIQVEAFGGLDHETRSRIQQLTRSQKGRVDDVAALPARPRVGIILVREWRGVEHRVLVLDKGFEHREQRYQSLTHVARAITGTRWSGPRFFGLEAKQVSASASDGGGL